MKRDVIITRSGLYHRGPDGILHPVASGTPDVHVCRRVPDFPGGRAPAGAVVDVCELCAAPVARQPVKRGPIVCMQCSGIQPLPQAES